MGILELLGEHHLLFDGGMGALLQMKGLKGGEAPDIWNLTHPEVVSGIHRAYFEAGSDVATTNTFGSSRLKLEPSGYTVNEVVGAAVRLAKEAAGSSEGQRYVALDIGPLPQMIEPYGDLTEDEAYELFREQVLAGSSAGADLVIGETFSDLNEARLFVKAAKENCSLPVFCTMTFEESGRTFMGVTPQAAVETLENMGINAIGSNCSCGPEQMLPISKEFLKYAKIPVIAQPNAGLPTLIDGAPVYNVSPAAFAKTLAMIKESGVKVLGGCCGTTPDFIAAMQQRCRNCLTRHCRRHYS